jgi:hypothetical protein
MSQKKHGQNKNEKEGGGEQWVIKKLHQKGENAS